MKHYKSVEDLINEMEICQTTYAEALLSARYFDRERLNLQVALELACSDLAQAANDLADGIAYSPSTEDYIKQAVEQINKDTCPLCQKLMQQTDTIQMIGNQVYHQSCWLSRDKSTEL